MEMSIAVVALAIVAVFSLAVSLVTINFANRLRRRNRILRDENENLHFDLIAAQKEKADLEDKAMTDYLTGLPNRLYAQESFPRIASALFSRGNQLNVDNGKVAVMVLDLDRFKNINDTHGHKTGDDVLRQASIIFKKMVRQTDLVCRWGGEEFIIVAPNVTKEMARDIAEKVRLGISDHWFGHGELKVTISIGVTSLNQNESLDDVVSRADEALYRAKEKGRNQVVFY